MAMMYNHLKTNTMSSFIFVLVGLMLSSVPQSSSFVVAPIPKVTTTKSLQMSSSPTNNFENVLENKNVFVVGGSGRVGGSVVTQLLKENAQVSVGGTSYDNFVQSQNRWKE